MNKFKRFVSGAVVSAVAMMSVGSVIPQVNNMVSLEASAASTINNPVIWSDVPDDDVIRVGDSSYHEVKGPRQLGDMQLRIRYLR